MKKGEKAFDLIRLEELTVKMMRKAYGRRQTAIIIVPVAMGGMRIGWFVWLLREVVKMPWLWSYQQGYGVKR